MAASIEHALICKIIENRDFHTVEKLKIDESFFLSDSQTIEVFRFIRDHYHTETTYGAVPSWELLSSRFFGFPWVGSNDTIQTLCQELRRYKMRAQLLTITEEIVSTVEIDPNKALDALKDATVRLTAEHDISSDLLLSQAYDRLLEDYTNIATHNGITGIPWPWEILNEDTQGMHPGNFIVLYGRPKSLKTWMALYIAANAYMKNQRVLIYSLEMSEKDILRRVASIICGIDYGKFKKAQLDPATQEKVWQTLLVMRDEEKLRPNKQGRCSAILAVHPRSESSGISTLQAKIREFQPDLVIVDGMYLMRDDRQRTRSIDWKSVAHISQDIKQTASIFNIPIIAVTQANRKAESDPKKADMMELAYADALAQDCDLCIRVSKQMDQATHELELVLSIPGSREGTLDAFVIHGVPASNFNFKRTQISDPQNTPQVPTAPTGGKKGGGGTPPPLAVNFRPA
jgi:replicative DNA helicase